MSVVLERLRRSAVLTAAVLALIVGPALAPSSAGATIDSVTVVPSPNPGTVYNLLDSVSCVSESWCVAVGNLRNESIRQTLVVMTDGGSWSVVPSPNVGDGSNALYDVTCLSSSACFAVGYSRSGSVRQPLVLEWDGSVWSVVPSPNPGVEDSVLSSVSCVSMSWCTAVGDFDDEEGNPKSLVLSWNGSVWSVVPSPSAGSSESLRSVSCVSTSSCVAVGFIGVTRSDPVTETLILVWDGSVWSVVPSPNPGPDYSVLSSVSCVSASWCTAVGDFDDDEGDRKSLILSWDGSVWSVVPNPSTAISDSLESVSCVSTSSCTAVGVVDAVETEKSLVLVWDGSVWSVVPSPSPGLETFLTSVWCGSTTSCTAVGYIYDGSVSETLIVSLVGTTPSDPTAPVFTG